MLQAALWAIHVLAAAAHTGVSSPGATRWTGLDIREGLNFAAAEPEGDSNQTDGEAPADGNPGDSDDDHSDEPGEMDCADVVSFRVQITVLGKLGPLDGPEPSPEEKAQKKDKASKWLFSTLLRSMLHGKSEQYKLSTTAVPTIDVKTVEPFTKTENGQRSPLESTIINIDFPETDVCSAAAFGRDVCGDYDSADEELLNGFLRALDVSAQYPRQAIEAVSKAGLGPKSMIMLRAVSIDGPTSMSICNWGTRFSSASIQGALLLPDCPANSARCEDRPHLCSADEAQWRCKCTLGYEGELTIPGLEGDVKDFAGPFSVVGSCNAIEGYCQLGGRYALKLASGENAKGVLGETATPDCEEGFEAAGSSQCAEGHSKQGMWSPEPRCNYIPPTAPPEPFCSAPPQDGTLSLKGCSLCMGVEAGKSGPECNCEVTCAAGHEEVGTIKSGRKDCVASEFPCPAAVHMDDAGCALA
ncbi:unnamed protein product [Effrenium voratum]|nr:unnamed protein product [Effrenium voratum]